ncbi:hypothetical protein BJ138DRAFT_1019360 [Hygrophoropsis aurantiaca]|uniref:Uncharacterized protein n=1 Tax=Hygrophoropsis aurantiaca TaxID=72124 RepID=A0ACB7ZU75_9AGAM|nr:hypothetical protein BJ138DRAFT_1019360 [Hygrophoropsis aurantiaca]
MNRHVWSYLRARRVIQILCADPSTLAKYKDIAVTDLSVNKDVTEENRYGQGNHKMAWFWAMGKQSEQHNGWMKEYYRINWLKAKARCVRWEEELDIVWHEMSWTINWFNNRRNRWKELLGLSLEPGRKAYAEKQIAMWGTFVEGATQAFEGK